MPLLPWVQNNSFLYFIIQLTAIYALRELLIYQLRRKKLLFYSILYPGVILHEVGHLVGCKLGGAKICSVKLVSSSGGEVVHENSKIPILGNFIISIFPLIFGVAMIYFLVFLLETNFQEISRISVWIIKFASYYLIIATLLTMFPSIQDVKNAFLIYFLMVVAIVLIILKTNWSVPTSLNNILYFCVFCLVVVNLIMLILLLFKRN